MLKRVKVLILKHWYLFKLWYQFKGSRKDFNNYLRFTTQSYFTKMDLSDYEPSLLKILRGRTQQGFKYRADILADIQAQIADYRNSPPVMKRGRGESVRETILNSIRELNGELV